MLSVPDYSKATVVVIGDVMLDRYFAGPALRISPEAPVPVVRIDHRESRPGGAANVALNIASLGAKAVLIGLTGEDAERDELKSLLEKKGVECRFVTVKGSPTVTKLRILSRHQQLLRIDFEEQFHQEGLDELANAFSEALEGAGAVVFSDYAKGALVKIRDLIAMAKERNIPLLVDPKSDDFTKYSGVTTITPNTKEFELAAGKAKDEEDLLDRAVNLIRKANLGSLLITQSENGMTLVRPDGTFMHLPTEAREVYDVTGAGDTVIGVLAASLAAGASMEDACRLSNAAAGVVVGKLGTSTVSEFELAGALDNREQQGFGVVDEERLMGLVSAARSRGERIVMTNGCFDIIHPGHIAYLREARALGDRLIVAVNSDDSVKRLKGPERPVNTLQDRMDVLAGIDGVDWVVPFSEDTPQRLIGRILPDILVKGGDYKPEDIAGYKEVTEHGGEVKVLCFKDSCSTTKIINRIEELCRAKGREEEKKSDGFSLKRLFGIK